MVLDELGSRGELDWTSAIVDAASVRAKKGIADRAQSGRPGQERQQAAGGHVLSDAQGLPLALGVSGANVHDSQALLPLVLGIARSARGVVRADAAPASSALTRHTTPPSF